MKLKGSGVAYGKRYFFSLFFPVLFCFCLPFFLLSHKKVVLQIIGVFDHIYYILRVFFNWMNLTIC